MKGRRLAWAGTGFLLLATAPAALAQSAPGVQSGWWNEASVGPIAPTTASSGQIQVSYDTAGPLAFSAVRVTPPGGTAPGAVVTLRLAISSGSSVGTPAVSACPTTTAWKPGADQTAPSAPAYSCQTGRRADGRVSGGTESWTYPLSWGSAGAVSVALVPTPGTSSPFSVTYSAPAAGSVTLTVPAPAPAAPVPSQAPGATSPAAVPFGPPAGAATATGSLAGEATPTAAGVVGPNGGLGNGPAGPTLAAPAGGSPAAATTGAAPIRSPSAAVVAAPASAPAGGGTRGSPGTNRAGRIMAFGLLVATGLALFALASQPARPARLLGPLGAGGTSDPGAEADPVRGIGRFARPRVGPPRRI